jgi:hypothetical protein
MREQSCNPRHTQFEAGARTSRGCSCEHRALVVFALAAALFASGCSDDDASEEGPARDAAVDGRVDADAEVVDASEPVAPLASGFANVGFNAVWGSSADDVWIVGSAGNIIRWDGRALVSVESPTTRSLTAVYGNGPDDVWIVGEAGVAFHWNGFVFEDYSASEDVLLLGVWASGPEDVWMVGTVPNERRGLVRRYDGTEATNSLVPGCNSLWEVWGSGPQDVWMVGSSPEIAGLALHGDGKSFGRVDFVGGPLRSVWGSAEEDVWMIPYDSAAQHWDGSMFTEAGEAPDQPMLGAWGSEASDVWSVGLGGAIWHYDGEAWSPSDSGTDVTLWSVWGSGSDDVWVVGGSGTLLRWRGDGWKKFAAPRS